jgi:hypothetical protein
VFLKSIVMVLILVSTSVSLDYTKEYIIKDRIETIQFWVKAIVENYFVIEKFQIDRFETLPIIIDDVLVKLEVVFTYNGFNTYRVLFNYQFYELSETGLKKINVSKKAWNLITAIDGEVKTKFYGKILYDW